MTAIQIDMFDVQLGAAILLQFQVNGRPVRVLADAGIKASGYSADHVMTRLLPILDESGGRHIDLVVGTHYDEDHLVGLVPIIRHDDITIGEAWMPPVANDSEPHALDASIGERDLLANQFYREDGTQRLEAYLRAKRADVEALLVFEGKREMQEEPSLYQLRKSLLEGHSREQRLVEELEGSDHEDNLAFLREFAEIPEAPDRCVHAAELEVERSAEIDAAIARARRGPVEDELYWFDHPRAFSLDHQLEISKYVEERSPEAAAAQKLSFADIRRSSARDAINASALDEVVTALREERSSSHRNYPRRRTPALRLER